MKKHLLGFVALASMLFATSCSQDADFNGPGKDGTVNFNVGIAQKIASRAISDGLSADLLIYQVYDAAGNPVLEQQGTAELTDLTANVQVTLPAGTYKIAFWAQDADCQAYNTADLTNIQVSYDGALCNDETRDAFFAVTEFTVNGDSNEAVTLYRPFAQINVAFDGDTDYTNSQLTVDGTIYNTLNILTGVASGEETGVTFATADVPAEQLVTTVNDEEQTYTYLAMTYVLVNNDRSTVNVTTDLNDGATTLPVADNVPVQRNYRTNIIYNVSNGQIDFDVDIDSDYEKPDNNEFGEGNEGEEPTEKEVTYVLSGNVIFGGNGQIDLTLEGDIASATFPYQPEHFNIQKLEDGEVVEYYGPTGAADITQANYAYTGQVVDAGTTWVFGAVFGPSGSEITVSFNLDDLTLTVTKEVEPTVFTNVTVGEFNGEGIAELSATYTPVDAVLPGPYGFKLTPNTTARAEAEEITISGNYGNGTLTATVNKDQLTPGFTYTVAAFAGEGEDMVTSATGTTGTLTAPAEEEPEPQPQPVTVTFDFVNNDYGLERKSGSAQDGYLEEGQQITFDGVTLTFSGNKGWRLWSDGLREYKNNPTFTVTADGNEVTAVSWTGAAAFKLDGTDSAISNKSWEGSETSVKFVGTVTATSALATLTVTYMPK